MKFIGLCIRKNYVQFNFTLTGLLQCGHLIPLWVTSNWRQLISKMTLRFCLSGSVSSTASACFFAFILAHSLVSTSYSSSLSEGVTLDVNMSIFLLKEHGFCVKVSWREDVSVDVDVEAPGVVEDEDETATETLELDAVVVSAGSRDWHIQVFQLGAHRMYRLHTPWHMS